MNIAPNTLFFIHATRACALQMLSNANYIQRELPSLGIRGELRLKIEAVCDSLIDTKHDMITEAFELDELVRTGASKTKLAQKMGRISHWLSESLGEMHELVMELERLISTDASYSLVFSLIVESATNIANSLPIALKDEESEGSVAPERTYSSKGVSNALLRTESFRPRSVS
jgi:hypothetical protein